MRTTRSSSLSRGVSTRYPREQAPPSQTRHTVPDQAPPQDQASPWEQTPLQEQAPPGAAPPPCGQNHSCLWKYNLVPTSLRAVKIYTTVMLL